MVLPSVLSFDVTQSQSLVHVLSDGEQVDSSHVSPRIPTPPPSPSEETDQTTAPGTWFFSIALFPADVDTV